MSAYWSRYVALEVAYLGQGYHGLASQANTELTIEASFYIFSHWGAFAIYTATYAIAWLGFRVLVLFLIDKRSDAVLLCQQFTSSSEGACSSNSHLCNQCAVVSHH